MEYRIPLDLETSNFYVLERGPLQDNPWLFSTGRIIPCVLRFTDRGNELAAIASGWSAAKATVAGNHDAAHDRNVGSSSIALDEECCR